MGERKKVLSLILKERKRILSLILIMAMTSLIVGGIAITLLYRTAFNEQRERLAEIVQNQSCLMEAIARFNAEHYRHIDMPGGTRAASLSEIIRAYQNYEYSGRTTKIDIAERKGDTINFLFSTDSGSSHNDSKIVQFDSKRAEPMRRALSGYSGTLVGINHQGKTVVAAHEPVADLNLGIVAQIELSEIRTPFIKAGVITGFFSAWMILIGTILIKKVSDPLIKTLEERAGELTKANDNLNQEITERKRVEKALVKSEAQYRSIFENSGAASIIMEDDKTISMINSKFEELTGYTRQEIEGKIKWPALVTDECLETMMKYHTERRKPGNNVPTEYEGQVIDKEENVKDVLIKIGMIPGTKKSIGSYMDITQRKQRENTLRRYKTIVDTSNDHLMLLDKNFMYQVVNNVCSRALNKNMNEIIGHSVTEMFDKKIFENVIKPELDRCLEGEIARYQHWFDFPSSPQRFMDVVYYPYFEENQTIAGIVVTVRDITDIKQTQKKLETALKEKEILIRELYHRTKNNIQVINSLITLQSSYIKDKQALTSFKEIKNRINSIALVHEKLYQSKDLSRIDLKDYINDFANTVLMNYNVNSSKIALDIIADSIPVLIDTAVPCGLVINEILSNALKYAFPEDNAGEIKIDLNLADEGEIDLKISDNGIGLSKDFDFRNTNTLGMQLIVGLVENQLGGTVTLNTGNGTEFQIKFKEIYKERI